MEEIILYKNNRVTLKTATINTKLTGRSIIVSNRWEYVRFYLKTNNKKEALFYWNQAEEFYKASGNLSYISSPLPLYYCFLNAAKALLKLHPEISYGNYHGVSGKSSCDNIKKVELLDQKIIIKSNGICPALLRYFDGTEKRGADSQGELGLDMLLANLVFIHRSFAVSQKIPLYKEMFIPLDEVCFIRNKKTKYINIRAKIDDKYAKHNSVKSKSIKEVDVYDYNGHTYLKYHRSRVKLNDVRHVSSKTEVIAFHKKIRKVFVEISAGVNSRWYLKDTSNDNVIDLLPQVIIFCCMHRLSELSRYEPEYLDAYLTTKHSWVLSEFLSSAPFQFINSIAAEITGEQLGVSRYNFEI